MDRINFCLIALGIAGFVYLVEPRTVYLDGVAPRVMRYEPADMRSRQYQTLNTSAPVWP